MCHYTWCAILTRQAITTDRETADFGRLLLLAKKAKGGKKSLSCVVCGHNPERGIGNMLDVLIIDYYRIGEYEQQCCHDIPPLVFNLKHKG